jgi:hypothetical protein
VRGGRLCGIRQVRLGGWSDGIRLVDAEPTAGARAIDAAGAVAWDGGARGRTRDVRTAGVGGAESRSKRHLLLPALQALQAHAGWISEGGGTSARG